MTEGLMKSVAGTLGLSLSCKRESGSLSERRFLPASAAPPRDPFMRVLMVLMLIVGMLSPVVAPVVRAASVAQQTGTIAGVALDADGKPLGGYTVRLRNVDTGEVIAETKTDAETGGYSFTDLPPGKYAAEVVDPSGDVVGTTSTIALAAGAVVTGVTVAATAAGAVAAAAAAGGLGALFSSTVGLAALAAGAGLGALAINEVTKENKVTICDVLPDGTRQTVEVNESEVDARLAAGATLGACVLPPASPSS